MRFYLFSFKTWRKERKGDAVPLEEAVIRMEAQGLFLTPLRKIRFSVVQMAL